MKKFKLLVFFLVSVLLMTACSSNGSGSKEKDTYVLRVSHPYQKATLHHQYMVWFDEEIQKRSDGRLSLEIYSDSQLMPPAQEIPGILQGQIDMTHSLSSIAGSFDPIWYFFDLPFLFDYDPKDPMVYMDNRKAFVESEKGGRLIARMAEEKGLKVLSLGSTDLYATLWTADESKMITDTASAHGLKLRTPGGRVAPETLKAIKASGISIPGTELPTALQQGVVDGLITVPLYLYDNKLPVKTQTLYPFVNYVMPVMMSQKKFDSLPEDLQEILVETGKDLEQYAYDKVSEEIADVNERLESEQGIKTYYPTPEEIEEWKKVTEPAWDSFLKSEPRAKELIEEAMRLRDDN
ncbi:TRAP transporter substrate-binding protein [Siminovitchia acidinfaciens]|uniref:TRAP transporter substrate-binding protein n=1 Tax=Siminovitchia acidinfaciens TaxID=2321395 RepID=A0A429XUJ1_9BACI|nr:TRAP transporter substrate-binding protein [Siminovitchia acidinfaciens]RST71829.1 TRAP transporter substrate-binding protein [Siminovitchia acidinfaciens]